MTYVKESKLEYKNVFSFNAQSQISTYKNELGFILSNEATPTSLSKICSFHTLLSHFDSFFYFCFILIFLSDKASNLW